MGRRDLPKCCKTCEVYNECMVGDPKKPCDIKANSEECGAWRKQRFCPAMFCKKRRRRVIDKEQAVMW